MVMLIQSVADISSYRVQAVIVQLGEDPTCLPTSAVESIRMGRQSISLKHGSQTAFIKATIVSHNRHSLQTWMNLLPDLREGGLQGCVCHT